MKLLIYSFTFPFPTSIPFFPLRPFPNDAVPKGKVYKRNVTVVIKELWDMSSGKELQLWDSFFRLNMSTLLTKLEKWVDSLHLVLRL